MPFKSAKQEIAMMINSPKVWRDWVTKYGHHHGFKRAMEARKKKQETPKRKQMGKLGRK